VDRQGGIYVELSNSVNRIINSIANITNTYIRGWYANREETTEHFYVKYRLIRAQTRDSKAPKCKPVLLYCASWLA
jgi:hypothetical protein